MRNKLAIVAGLGLLLVAAPVWAHHAFAAEFDSTKPVKLRGTITKMEWINPHAWMHLEVKKKDGTVENWMIEAGPPGALIRRGWKKDSVGPGAEGLVECYQALDGSNRAKRRE